MKDGTKTAIDQALNAWIKFRGASPDFYFPNGSEVDGTWEDLDEAMTTLDEEFSEEKRVEDLAR